jgi:hypothetical protein
VGPVDLAVTELLVVLLFVEAVPVDAWVVVATKKPLLVTMDNSAMYIIKKKDWRGVESLETLGTAGV